MGRPSGASIGPRRTGSPRAGSVGGHGHGVVLGGRGRDEVGGGAGADGLPGFRIRDAAEGESLVTLDGERRELTERDLLICDAADVPISNSFGPNTLAGFKVWTDLVEPEAVAAT